KSKTSRACSIVFFPMGESVTPDAMAAICQFEKTDVGARFMGKTIRVDETGELVSVKDAIVAIEGCTTKAAQMKIQKLIADGKISEDTNPDFKYFMDGSYR
ncbi:MAG: hypothetical protein QMC37_01920, partial [Flavobacteriales bacterium]